MKISNIYLRNLMSLQENENLFSFTVKDGVAFVTVLGRTKMVQFSSAFVTVLPNIKVGEMAQFLNKSKNIFILLIFILVLTNFDINLANNDCDLYYASLLFGSYLVDKRITVNAKKTVYNNLIKRHMRKAAQNTVLTVAQKQGISSYLYEFIKDVVDKSNKKQELLPNVVEYFKDNSMGEFVLKQTIVKVFFQNSLSLRKKFLISLKLLQNFL